MLYILLYEGGIVTYTVGVPDMHQSNETMICKVDSIRDNIFKPNGISYHETLIRYN